MDWRKNNTLFLESPTIGLICRLFHMEQKYEQSRNIKVSISSKKVDIERLRPIELIIIRKRLHNIFGGFLND